MQKIVSQFTKYTKVKKDDDFADRLSHRVTVVILVVFTIVISASLYVGKPITCWVPKHFTGSHTKYTNSYCWVKNTYYLPYEEYIPKAHEEDQRQEIIYYQWLPFIMLLQAFFFYLPTTVWHNFNQKGGIDCDNILACANQMERIDKASAREKTLRLLVKQMDRFLNSKVDRGTSKSASAITKTLCCLCGSRLGNYLGILFIFSKVLYLANAIGQLFALNAILKTTYNIFGFEFLDNIGNEDGYWINSPIFPRVTMCDFRVRRLGNVQRYTVQCVLPINMYTEKIYTFLWFWFVFVAAVTAVNLLTWLARFIMTSDSVKYIKNHVMQEGREVSSERVREFIDTYLRTDGVFILRLISHNTNYITSTDVIKELWEFWLEKRASHPEITPTTDDDPIDPEMEKLKEY